MRQITRSNYPEKVKWRFAAAGILLTGGSSRRMGKDKAAIVDVRSGLTWAQRTARLLEAHTAPVLEVGPGFTDLPAVQEDPVGTGPLAAVAAGARAVAGAGWTGPVVVLSTDLPRLTAGMVSWLVSYQPGRTIVPVAGGRAQPLCARYTARDLQVAGQLVAAGRASMSSLLSEIDAVLVDSPIWSAPAGDASCLDDVDRPDQLDG